MSQIPNQVLGAVIQRSCVERVPSFAASIPLGLSKEGADFATLFSQMAPLPKAGSSKGWTQLEPVVDAEAVEDEMPTLAEDGALVAPTANQSTLTDASEIPMSELEIAVDVEQELGPDDDALTNDAEPEIGRAMYFADQISAIPEMQFSTSFAFTKGGPAQEELTGPAHHVTAQKRVATPPVVSHAHVFDAFPQMSMKALTGEIAAATAPHGRAIGSPNGLAPKSAEGALVGEKTHVFPFMAAFDHYPATRSHTRDTPSAAAIPIVGDSRVQDVVRDQMAKGVLEVPRPDRAVEMLPASGKRLGDHIQKPQFVADNQKSPISDPMMRVPQARTVQPMPPEAAKTPNGVPVVAVPPTRAEPPAKTSAREAEFFEDAGAERTTSLEPKQMPGAAEFRHAAELPRRGLPVDAGPGAEIARRIAPQLAVHVTNSSGATDIALNPEELGRVRMMIQHHDGAMALTITAERGDTLELMRRHVDQLTQEFRGLGYREVNISFQGGNAQGQPGQNAGQQSQTPQQPESALNGERAQIEIAAADDAAQSAALIRPNGGLDLRL